jgi:hypothetical protein
LSWASRQEALADENVITWAHARSAGSENAAIASSTTTIVLFSLPARL